MSTGIVIDSDYYMFTKFHYQADLTQIELNHKITLELDSSTHSATLDVSAVTNPSILIKPGSQLRIFIKPFKANASKDLNQLFDRVRSESARFEIPVPLCLNVLQEDELFKSLVDNIRAEKQKDLELNAVKFYVSQVAQTSVSFSSSDGSKAPLRVRGICDPDRSEYIKGTLQSIMRDIALELVDELPAMKAFFNPVKNVEQFSFSAKPVALEIKVYTADLTQLPFDAIVCPCDASLSFRAGAAKAIANKAGPELLKARDLFLVANSKGLKATACWAMKAVGLPARFVFFTFAPGLKELAKTYVNVFEECNSRNLHSVAVPLIGAGQMGGSLKECTAQLYKGLKQFIEKHSRSLNMRELHIVNLDAQCTQVIESNLHAHKSVTTKNMGTVWIAKEGVNPFATTFLEESKDQAAASSLLLADGDLADERRGPGRPASGLHAAGPISVSSSFSASSEPLKEAVEIKGPDLDSDFALAIWIQDHPDEPFPVMQSMTVAIQSKAPFGIGNKSSSEDKLKTTTGDPSVLGTGVDSGSSKVVNSPQPPLSPPPPPTPTTTTSPLPTRDPRPIPISMPTPQTAAELLALPPSKHTLDVMANFCNGRYHNGNNQIGTNEVLTQNKLIVGLRTCNGSLCVTCALQIVRERRHTAIFRPQVYAPRPSDLNLIRWRMFKIASANLYNVNQVVDGVDSGEGMLELVLGIWTGSSDDDIDTDTMTPWVLYVRCTAEGARIVADLESRIAQPEGAAKLFSNRILAANNEELCWWNGNIKL